MSHHVPTYANFCIHRLHFLFFFRLRLSPPLLDYLFINPPLPPPSRSASRAHRAGDERWGAGVETQKNVRGEIGGWGRVPFNEPYAPSLSTIYDGA